jgi:hypothetical protein
LGILAHYFLLVGRFSPVLLIKKPPATFCGVTGGFAFLSGKNKRCRSGNPPNKVKVIKATAIAIKALGVVFIEVAGSVHFYKSFFGELYYSSILGIQ